MPSLLDAGVQEGGHHPSLPQLQPSAVGEVLPIIPPCLMTPGHAISAAQLQCLVPFSRCSMAVVHLGQAEWLRRSSALHAVCMQQRDAPGPAKEILLWRAGSSSLLPCLLCVLSRREGRTSQTAVP